MMDVGTPATFPVVVVASSAGGIEALSTILQMLPRTFPAAMAIVQHRPPAPGLLAEALTYLSKRVVLDARDGDRLAPGCIFIAPAGRHLLANRDGTLSLSDSAKVRYTRPAADMLFASAAESFNRRLIAVVLTGYGHDGSEGIEVVRRVGGKVIVQAPETSQASSMPESAIETGCFDYVLPLDEIGPALAWLVELAPE